MKLLKVSEFFSNEMPSILLGGFFSRRLFTEDNKYIIIYTFYKESQKIETQEIDYNTYANDYIKALNEETGLYPYWYTKEELLESIDISLSRVNGQAFFVLENDININEDGFYNKLYAKIISSCEWLYDEKLNEEKKSFIRGYMELRGSIDTTADYIAQDYFYDSLFEMKKARMLVDYLSIPHNVVNINFRELQHDYYAGIRTRNTQLRINIWWYMENVGMINGYKAEIFALSRGLNLTAPTGNIYFFYNDDKRRRAINNILDERLNFYSSNVFGKSINEEDIQKMRNELKFDSAPGNIRSRALVEAIKYLTPDECVCCKNRYHISDRSYINRNTGRYYFEIHHVISIGSNKELDDENNMVKLCPACHRNLKRGSGTELEQKELIREIFRNAPNTLDFAEHFFNTKDFELIVDMTYKSLN